MNRATSLPNSSWTCFPELLRKSSSASSTPVWLSPPLKRSAPCQQQGSDQRPVGYHQRRVCPTSSLRMTWPEPRTCAVFGMDMAIRPQTRRSGRLHGHLCLPAGGLIPEDREASGFDDRSLGHDASTEVQWSSPF